MIRNNSIIFILILSTLVACQKKFDTSQELLAFLKNEENGYSQTKVVNGVSFSLTQKPVDLIIAQELGQTSNKDTIDLLRDRYNDKIYFMLSISKNGNDILNTVANDGDHFGGMVNDFAFEVNNKVYLYTPEKDTLEMIDFVSPRMFGTIGSSVIMLVYKKDKKILAPKYVNLVIKDMGFNTGDVKFKIDVENLKKEPKLNFNL